MKTFINEIKSGKRHINPKLIEIRNILFAVVFGIAFIEFLTGCIFGVTPMYVLYLLLK